MNKNLSTVILALLLPSIARAELPDIISDPATREVVEYLDSKVTQILTSTSGIRGPAGPMGPIGPTGATGATGATGPAGDAATVSIGTTTTVSSTTLAQVYNTGTSSAAILGFILPAGPQGVQGIQGIQGPTGPAGTADNLGNHIATQTITAGYGISASTITTTGNIGIGTTAPSSKLHVSSGTITVDGTGANIVTPSITLGGVTKTAWPATGTGTGDVVLAATQTFTGANTFTGSVTVSSLTIVGGRITGVSNSSSTLLSGSFAVNSTSFVGNTCVTGSTIAITTNGGRVMLGAQTYGYSGSANVAAFLGAKVDGVSLSSKGLTRTNLDTINVPRMLAFTFITSPLTAGIHSFCLDAKYGSSPYSLNYNGSAADIDSQFWVMELK